MSSNLHYGFVIRLKLKNLSYFNGLHRLKFSSDVDILYARPLHALYLSSSGPFLCLTDSISYITMFLNEVLNGVMTFTANGSLPSFVIKSKIKFEFFFTTMG